MRRFRTILIAADFSEGSKESFRLACSLADKDAARLVVLHVVEPLPLADQPVVLGEFGVPVPLDTEQRTRHESLLASNFPEMTALSPPRA